MQRNIYLDNLPLDTAQARWREALAARGLDRPLAPESVAVDEALGRVTAAAVFARQSSPFYNAAAMDGIAVRVADTLGASETRPVRLAPHQYRPVNTGNVIPEDYNAVIMIEDVHEIPGEGGVEILAATTPWRHVRTIGEDIVQGELILPEGHRIRPIDLGAMLAAGLTEIPVRRQPAVAILPTGSDVVQPGTELAPGNIIEFNGRVLAGVLAEWGARPTRRDIVPDEPGQLRAALQASLAAHDLVILNAGASAGERDFSAGVLREMGDVVVHGVNIKPGKPVILAIVNGKPVVGLPGYPVSTVLTAQLFARELVHTLAGRRPAPPETAVATLSRPLASKMGTVDFVRVKLGAVGDHLMATPSGRGAGSVMNMALADGVLVVPAGAEGVGAGERVRVELFRPLHEVMQTLVFIGSHDNLLDVLANLLYKSTPYCRLSSAHVGSMGGIMAVKRGEAHLAGTHLIDEESGTFNVPFIRRHLAGVPLALVNLAHREQGLFVRRGNPKNIRGFADLAREGVRFVNRQKGAGTRILTDINLRAAGITTDKVQGYPREEYTHMAVASAVATGAADTGLGIRASAVALNLDFIPVAWERYDLIVPASHAGDEKVRALLAIIRESGEFRETVAGLGGYDLKDCGRVLYEQG